METINLTVAQLKTLKGVLPIIEGQLGERDAKTFEHNLMFKQEKNELVIHYYGKNLLEYTWTVDKFGNIAYEKAKMKEPSGG